jgi:hypothetical protein
MWGAIKKIPLHVCLDDTSVPENESGINVQESTNQFLMPCAYGGRVENDAGIGGWVGLQAAGATGRSPL